jgi:hypothetical protein
MTQARRSGLWTSTRTPNAHSRAARSRPAGTSLTCPRIREANPIGAAADGGPHRVNLENVVGKHRTERQRQVAGRARHGSTDGSQVASAKMFTWCWVIACHSPVPISWPTMPRRSAGLLNWVVIALQSGKAGEADLLCRSSGRAGHLLQIRECFAGCPVASMWRSERDDQATGSAAPPRIGYRPPELDILRADSNTHCYGCQPLILSDPAYGATALPSRTVVHAEYRLTGDIRLAGPGRPAGRCTAREWGSEPAGAGDAWRARGTAAASRCRETIGRMCP